MAKQTIADGVVHKTPPDMRKAIAASRVARAAWADITPLARNEFVCWVTSAKKAETRSHRIERLCEDLAGGKRRPCCWPGCPHR